MNYMQYIESTQEWTCPKSGKWKVICVGGGGSGYTEYSSKIYTGNPGGTTSFGTYLSANGGAGGSSGSNPEGSVQTAYGINGYAGCIEYSSISNRLLGIGYGASGGATSTISISLINAGSPGEIRTTVVDIEENSVISCTVGEGGESVQSGSNYANHKAFGGAAGAVILEYLG